MASKQLQFVLVTPEKVLLDQPVDALQFPLFDGQIGILPGRAPLVGRLGYGELKIRSGSNEQRYFIDGGFVQVNGPVVSLLTHRALPAASVSASQAEQQLQEALSRKPKSPTEFTAKDRDTLRARRMLAMAKRV